MEGFKKFLNFSRLKNILKKKENLGKKGEKVAVKYLKNLGLEIIECGFKAMRGEIDIIARENDTIVFVEVKTRKTNEFGSPLEAVDSRKQSQIKKIASIYILRRYQRFIPCRFDVVGITVKEGGDYEISHVRNAF